MFVCLNRSLRFVRWHSRILWGVGAIASLLTCWALLDTNSPVRSSGIGRRLRTGPAVHLCMGSDDTDLRPAAVAMRSAIQASEQPGRLRFHFITTSEFTPLFQELLATHVPEANIQMHHDERLRSHIEQSIGFRASSEGIGNRPLANLFEFVPFYVSRFLNERPKDPRIRRVVYIETDTVILGDLAELYDLNLKGAPVAAVKSCSQHYQDYLNFPAMAELGFTTLNPGTCIADRTITVIDLERWEEMNVTGHIEQWMEQYRRSKTDLWYGRRISLVPWLLALNGNFQDLGSGWSCRNLASDSMSLSESKTLRKNGFDHTALKQLGVEHSEYGSIQPYIATCSAMANVLRFDGSLPPWEADSFGRQRALCAVPDSFAGSSWRWMKVVKLFCEGTRFVKCGDIWGSYLSYETSCALKDFDKEWRDDEKTWSVRKHHLDAKAERDNREASRLEREEREMERREQEERERREVEETDAQEALNKKKAKRKEMEERVKAAEKKGLQKRDEGERTQEFGDDDDEVGEEKDDQDPDFVEMQPYENLDIF